MVVPILLGIITLVGIIYLAVSRKSSFKVRVTALGALALMVIAVVVCLLIGFGVIGNSDSRVVVLPDAELYDAPPPVPEPNFFVMIMLIIFLIAVFVIIAVLSLKEKQSESQG